MQRDERARRYGDTALAGLLRAVRASGAPGQSGGRNEALNVAAYRAGRLIAGGALADPENITEDLVRAALDAGLPEREARATVKSGITAGQRKPVAPPASGHPSAHRPRQRPNQERGAPNPAPPPPVDSRGTGAPERSYPPRDEVGALWENAGPADDPSDREAGAWFAERGLDPLPVRVHDLARLLPPAHPCPSWATMGRSWADRGYRLLIPLCNERGELISINARSILIPPPPGTPKEAGPKGYKRAGLVMADGLARALLADDPEAPRPNLLVIAEGGPDFLTAALAWGEAGDAFPPAAVIGVFAGSWSDALAARVPDGLPVILATHADTAGDGYALAIARTLAARCPLQRMRLCQT